VGAHKVLGIQDSVGTIQIDSIVFVDSLRQIVDEHNDNEGRDYRNSRTGELL
jgi:hypothetical protein